MSNTASKPTDTAEAFEKIAQVIRVHQITNIWAVMFTDGFWVCTFFGIDQFKRAFAGHLADIQNNGSWIRYRVMIEGIVYETTEDTASRPKVESQERVPALAKES